MAEYDSLCRTYYKVAAIIGSCTSQEQIGACYKILDLFERFCLATSLPTIKYSYMIDNLKYTIEYIILKTRPLKS